MTRDHRVFFTQGITLTQIQTLKSITTLLILSFSSKNNYHEEKKKEIGENSLKVASSLYRILFYKFVYIVMTIN